MRREGIKLTQASICSNPEYPAYPYVGLMAARDHAACIDCDPEQYRTGWHPLIADLFGCTAGGGS